MYKKSALVMGSNELLVKGIKNELGKKYDVKAPKTLFDDYDLYFVPLYLTEYDMNGNSEGLDSVTFVNNILKKKRDKIVFYHTDANITEEEKKIIKGYTFLYIPAGDFEYNDRGYFSIAAEDSRKETLSFLLKS